MTTLILATVVVHFCLVEFMIGNTFFTIYLYYNFDMLLFLNA